MTIDGQGYRVLDTPQGPAVERISDFAVVMTETLDAVVAQHPEFKDAMAQQPRVAIKQQGTATVGGRSSKAYFLQSADGVVWPKPVAVISSAPKLAELGKAMAQ